MWKCPKCNREFKNSNQDHYCKTIETIDQYIAEQVPEVQPTLNKICEVVRAAAPDAIEKISWQMPTFWQSGNLIHFAAFKRHISLFAGSEATSFFADRLTGYTTAKGTIQFPLDKPMPYDLIENITRWCVEARTAEPLSNQDMDTSKMKRKINDIPDDIAVALDASGLWERYRARPPYQRNDYIGWITRAKRVVTRQKRLNQMLDELRSGDAYMGMAYKAK